MTPRVKWVAKLGAISLVTAFYGSFYMGIAGITDGVPFGQVRALAWIGFGTAYLFLFGCLLTDVAFSEEGPTSRGEEL